MPMRFQDRADAGQQLADALASYASTSVVVLALPRGGVVLGAKVARALHAPLDLIITRKISHPANPEYAIGAVTETGHAIWNPTETGHLDPRWIAVQAAAGQKAAGIARRQAYLQNQPQVPLEGKTAILIDDGVATGLTMLAAIADVRQRHPATLVAAVPVIPPDTAQTIRQATDDLVALSIPRYFLGAVSAYYSHFDQVEDDTVIALMQSLA